MAGTTGLEPATSAVTGQRSNQLNYVPNTRSLQALDCRNFHRDNKLSLSEISLIVEPHAKSLAGGSFVNCLSSKFDSPQKLLVSHSVAALPAPASFSLTSQSFET